MTVSSTSDAKASLTPQPTLTHDADVDAENTGADALAVPSPSTEEAARVMPVDDYPSPSLPRRSRQTKVWAWPWVIFLLFLYSFILFWVNYAILQRYWILHNWNDSLPGLDKTVLRKFTMRSHMTAGAIALLLGPIQFVPFFRQRPRLRGVHRWSGRLYCICAILSSIFGLWFIALKRQLVGGYNMTLSFAMAGVAIGVTAFKAWQTARIARLFHLDTNSKASFVTHRNWGIRSYSQILAPALYRYWYAMMELFGLYNVPVPLRNGGYCDANDLCPDYSRTLDSIYSWFYWVSAWAVAEIVIYCLPAHDSSDDRPQTEEAVLTAPLLSSPNENNHNNDNSAPTNSATSYESNEQDVPRYQALSSTAGSNNGAPYVVNLVGCILACAAIAITGVTFYTVATQSPTES